MSEKFDWIQTTKINLRKTWGIDPEITAIVLTAFCSQIRKSAKYDYPEIPDFQAFCKKMFEAHRICEEKPRGLNKAQKRERTQKRQREYLLRKKQRNYFDNVDV